MDVPAGRPSLAVRTWETAEWPRKRFDGFAASWHSGASWVTSAADEFALTRWAAHGYQTDPASLGDTGSRTQLNQRDLTEVAQPALPDGFRFPNSRVGDLRVGPLTGT
jgi:hypothetical protein